jgi:hypothetical protein
LIACCLAGGLGRRHVVTSQWLRQEGLKAVSHFSEVRGSCWLAPAEMATTYFHVVCGLGNTCSFCCGCLALGWFGMLLLWGPTSCDSSSSWIGERTWFACSLEVAALQQAGSANDSSWESAFPSTLRRRMPHGPPCVAISLVISL